MSQDSTVPVKSLTDTLSKHFPQYKFAQGQSAEIKKVIDNSKVGDQYLCLLPAEPNVSNAAFAVHVLMSHWHHSEFMTQQSFTLSGPIIFFIHHLHACLLGPIMLSVT